MGPPGAGKGTQGARLGSAAGWHHLSTGDLLREHIRRGTVLGNDLRASMDRGELAPDRLVVGIVRHALSDLAPGANVVFDGFPRTVAQAEGFSDVLDEMGGKVDLVVVLLADDDVLVERLAGRRSCPECGAVYNIYLDPPETTDRCDRCGHRGLLHRADDEPETVRNRLRVYHLKTEPLIRYYENRDTALEQVDASQSVEQTQEALRAVVTRVAGKGTA